MIDQPRFRSLREQFNRLSWSLARLGSEPAVEEPQAQPVGEPLVDVWEDNGRLYLEVELAGVPSYDVEATVRGQELVITGERRSLGTGVTQWHRQQRPRGPFTLTVTLPAAILVDGLRYLCQDGILYVSAPLAVPLAARPAALRSS